MVEFTSKLPRVCSQVFARVKKVVSCYARNTFLTIKVNYVSARQHEPVCEFGKEVGVKTVPTPEVDSACTDPFILPNGFLQDKQSGLCFWIVMGPIKYGIEMRWLIHSVDAEFQNNFVPPGNGDMSFYKLTQISQDQHTGYHWNTGCWKAPASGCSRNKYWLLVVLQFTSFDSCQPAMYKWCSKRFVENLSRSGSGLIFNFVLES